MTQLQDEPIDSLEPETPEPAEHESSWPKWLNAATILLIFVIAGSLIWVLTGLYKINAGEVAVIERMGEFTDSIAEPGPHMSWPWPIDIVHKIPRDQMQTLIVNDFNQSPAAYAQFKRDLTSQGIPAVVVDAIFDPYLITADKNVLNVKIAVQYRISDPKAYLMSVSHGTAHNNAQIFAERERIIRQVALHVLIREIARTTIDNALSDQSALADRLLVHARAEAEQLKLGINIEKIDLQYIRWPAGVDQAFTEESRARLQKEAQIQAAEAYRTSMVNAARQGHAFRIIGEAEAYKRKAIDDARGEAERFRQVYDQYKKSPELTRVSVYSDAMSKVFKNVSRVILVQPGQRANLVLDPVEDKLPPVNPNGNPNPNGGQPNQ